MLRRLSKQMLVMQLLFVARGLPLSRSKSLTSKTLASSPPIALSSTAFVPLPATGDEMGAILAPQVSENRAVQLPVEPLGTVYACTTNKTPRAWLHSRLLRAAGAKPMAEVCDGYIIDCQCFLLCPAHSLCTSTFWQHSNGADLGRPYGPSGRGFIVICAVCCTWYALRVGSNGRSGKH